MLTKVVRPKIINQYIATLLLPKLQRTGTRGATDHQAELDTLLDILLSADLNL